MQLADFLSAFYEAMSNHQDMSQEQVAWLLSVERKTDHWRKIGCVGYNDDLVAIDPYGEARAMIEMQSNSATQNERRQCRMRVLGRFA